MNPRADRFFENAKQWKEEYILLREIILANDILEEDFKWMHPCYTFENKNVVIIHGFKDYCALLFHKGALMKDKSGILIQQTENVQAARQLRFTSKDEIISLRDVISDYVKEALKIEQSGRKVVLKTVSEYPVPDELQTVLDEDEAFQTAFYKLTPGRQKGYLYFFNQAKQSKTRSARIAKYYQHILNGKGLDDL